MFQRQSIEERIVHIEEQIRRLDALQEEMTAHSDVFTAAEHKGVNLLQAKLKTSLERMRADAQHRDSLVDGEMQTIATALHTRERVLNQYPLGEELFGIFKAEHARLVQTKEQHETFVDNL